MRCWRWPRPPPECIEHIGDTIEVEPAGQRCVKRDDGERDQAGSERSRRPRGRRRPRVRAEARRRPQGTTLPRGPRSCGSTRSTGTGNAGQKNPNATTSGSQPRQLALPGRTCARRRRRVENRGCRAPRPRAGRTRPGRFGIRGRAGRSRQVRASRDGARSAASVRGAQARSFSNRPWSMVPTTVPAPTDRAVARGHGTAVCAPSITNAPGQGSRRLDEAHVDLVAGNRLGQRGAGGEETTARPRAAGGLGRGAFVSRPNRVARRQRGLRPATRGSADSTPCGSSMISHRASGSRRTSRGSAVRRVARAR